MRKKIPTITRPDPAYAASLRPSLGEQPTGEVSATSAQKAMPVIGEGSPDDRVPSRTADSSSAPTNQTEREPVVPRALADTIEPARRRGAPKTRKIDIRVNALERQEEALIDCGVDPAHVIRAALRRAAKNWRLSPEYTPPREDLRTKITEWRARTSLAVDTPALDELLRTQDPLNVLSKWTLIRGQVEPRVWAEIDSILGEIALRAGDTERAGH